MKRLNTQEFIKRALSKHNGVYSYDKAQYINTNTKIIITCPVHGDFEQAPKQHLKGSGCSKCSDKHKPNTSEYNEQIRYKHIKCIEEYKTNSTNILHKCLKCNFKWSPKPNHIKGKGKCPNCDAITTSKYNKIINEKHIICLDEYVNTSVKLTHQCMVCFNEWYTKPSHVIFSGTGCPKCAAKSRPQNLPFTHKEYLSQISHLNIICLGVYVNGKTNIEHQCKVCKFIWSPRPSNIKNGMGCPNCHNHKTNTDKYKNKKTLIYYIKFDNGIYKIGITQKGIEERFKSDNINYEILEFEWFTDGYEAWKLEQKIIENNKSIKYNGPNFLRAGNTECFNQNIYPQL